MALVAKANSNAKLGLQLREQSRNCHYQRLTEFPFNLVVLQHNQNQMHCKCNYNLKLACMILNSGKCQFFNLLLILMISFLFTGCNQTRKAVPHNITTTEFAKGFSIKSMGSVVEVELHNPYPNASSSIKYLLVPKGEEVPAHSSEIQVIRTPIEKIVCTSTSHIALLDHLNALDKLVGFPSTDLISSAKARARIDSGLVTDLGIDKEMNLEMLVSLAPDVVMGYSLSGDLAKLNKINKFGIPVVINAEYLEDHPLGRAEWIKYMALFLEKSEMADSIFNRIKEEYVGSQELVNRITDRPTVLTGILYGDAWYLPGGQNYAAKLFRDAGYQYLWDDDTSNGFLNLSFESIYAKAKGADFWIGVGSFESREEMKSTEKRYGLFDSFQEGNVFTYDARKGATGGSEYLELGYSRPDIILKDLIKIAHPETLPEYELFFYKKLD